MDDFYRSLFENSPDAQIVVGPDGIIERTNKRVEQIFGYPEADLVGREVELLVPGRLREVHRQHRSCEFDPALVGCTRPLVYGRPRDGTECPLGINLSTIDTPGGPRILATIRDIHGWTDALDTHAAFDDAPVAMALATLTDDGDRVIRSANHAFARLLGVSRDGLLGASLRDFVHPDDRPESDDGARAIVAGRERTYHGRQRYRRHNGDYVWVEIYASLVTSPTADRRVLVHALDISELAALELEQREQSDALEAEVATRTAALVEAQRRLRLSLDAERSLLVESQEQQRRLDVSLRAAGLGTFEWDVLTGQVIYDERAASILGLDVDSAPAEQLLDLIEPSDRNRVVEVVSAGLDRHEPDDAVFRIGDHDDDSSPRWVHGWGQPVQSDDDTVRKIVGVLQDVTAERQEHLLVEEREQRLQMVLDVTVTGVFDWDLRRGSITFSHNWYGSIGYEPGDLDTDHWDWQRIVHPDDWPDTSRHMEAQLNGTVTDFTHDLRLRCKDGTWRWARLAAQVVAHDEHGRAKRVIGAETDISGQRLLEQQLVHAATMHSLGELAGGIAHDFNNVMAIVRGHTEFLLLRRSDDVDTERRLTAIDRAVERASSLVRELMLLGRPATDNPVILDLAEHIRTTSESWPAFLADDVALEVDVPGETFPVRIDASRLDALLLNVAVNARDAMSDGGTLRIELRRRDEAGREWAQILVRDTGAGMDPATLTSMFEPFFTTKGPGVGTGLGLATSYTTVTQAGGTISADSELGSGTTITISLPLARPDAFVASTENAAVGPQAAAAGSILVVEDEAEILEINADVLRLGGYRVYEALGGEEALEILRGGAEIDLMLTDAVMPGISGPQLAAKVREQWPHVRVLYLSGHAAATTATNSIDPTRLLTKPISAGDLIDAVGDVLAEVG